MLTEDFVNIKFSGFRGCDKVLNEFTLADLPFMNPFDQISLFNIVSKDEQKSEPIIVHLKRMIIYYIHEVANIDVEIALVLKKRPILKAKEEPKDIQKLKIGKI